MYTKCFKEQLVTQTTWLQMIQKYFTVLFIESTPSICMRVSENCLYTEQQQQQQQQGEQANQNKWKSKVKAQSRRIVLKKGRQL